MTRYVKGWQLDSHSAVNATGRVRKEVGHKILGEVNKKVPYSEGEIIRREGPRGYFNPSKTGPVSDKDAALSYPSGYVPKEEQVDDSHIPDGEFAFY